MYGTVARLRAKPGAIEQLREFANREQGNAPPGSVALLVFQMDADPNEFILVAVAESEEAYRANAESPEQHEQFLRMMQYLEAEPEWNDGAVVMHYGV
jgi:quinol monooxygenase YgiN